MSQAETFGHFRSFAVGIERNTRTLRRVLEEVENAERTGEKVVNGRCASVRTDRVGARCARAFECPGPEATTKELAAEAAEQQAILQDVEAQVMGLTPVDEVIEKYRAFAEYNELAFTDLEERLSAYGYTRPAAMGADVPSTGSTSPAGSEAGRVSKPMHREERHGEGHDCEERHGGEINDHMGDRGTEAEKADSGVGSGQAGLALGLNASRTGFIDDGRGGDGSSPGDATALSPERPLSISCEEVDTCGEDSPATPTLAEWELSEETREMLQREREERRIGEGISSPAQPRSLEAILADNPVLPRDGDATTARERSARAAARAAPRASVSSDWSPPAVKTFCSMIRRGAEGVDVCDTGDGYNGSSTTASTAAVTLASAAACVGVSDVTSPLGSDPPTPRMPSLEGRASQRGTPGRRRRGSSDRRLDRESSVETPIPCFSSPMKTPLGRSLVELSMIVPDSGTAGGKNPSTNRDGKGQGEESIGAGAASKNGAFGHWRNPDDESSLGDTLSSGPQEAFWGSDSPASPVTTQRVTPSRSASEGPCTPGVTTPPRHRGVPSPATPCTPPMLSPRHDASDAHGVGPSSTHTTARRSPDAATPTATPSGASRSFQTTSEHGAAPGISLRTEPASDGRDRDAATEFDDDCDDADDDCNTPELSSPPRTEIGVEQGNAGAVAREAAAFRHRLEQAGGVDGDGDGSLEAPEMLGGPLELVSEEEYARAPTFLTIQVSRDVLNEAIQKLNAYACTRVKTPSELLLTVDEMVGIINKGPLSRTLLLSAAHLKRVEVKGSRMYRIRAGAGYE